MTALATTADLEKAWRPLQSAEKPRAEYYIGVASRRLRRRWPDVDGRLTASLLAKDDVTDVVVHMVLGVLDSAPARGAKSWSQTSGPFSQSVTLEAGRTDLITIEPWMAEVFDGPPPEALPQGEFPASGFYEGLFERRRGR